jgi:SpoVK/Ycf46/Vps4 family AAA+-type ATPase
MREQPRVSLCLFGPSGTGKSEYVRHLARRMGRQLVEQRVSDIEDCWVGESEKNVARAFERASSEGAVVLFDEADSFLRARAGAHHRWEVTLVNEFLQRLEAHEGVVACTTNLFSDLDPAVLRRFTLKVELGFASPEQALLLFRAHLAPLVHQAVSDEEWELVASRLAGMNGLAPGDFAAVARRASLLAGAWRAEDLVRELEAELRLKNAGR